MFAKIVDDMANVKPLFDYELLATSSLVIIHKLLGS